MHVSSSHHHDDVVDETELTDLIAFFLETKIMWIVAAELIFEYKLGFELILSSLK